MLDYNSIWLKGVYICMCVLVGAHVCVCVYLHSLSIYRSTYCDVTLHIGFC